MRPALHKLVPLIVLASACATAAETARVPKRAVFEAALTAGGQYENPYVEVEATATLVAPDGQSERRAPLFWNGGHEWKFRFSPDTVGTWTWRVASNDSALDGQTGAFEVEPSTRSGSIRRMNDHPSHFARDDGAPFWFMGDTAWGLYSDNAAERHDREAALAYVDRRASQGFNVLHSMLLSEANDGNQGGAPFADLSAERINPTYWQEVDRRLEHVNRRGMVAGLALAWGDKLNRGQKFPWRQFPSAEARKRYARYIAARYAAYDTYFIVSGEWHAENRTREGTTPSAVRREFIELGNTIRDADPHGRMVAIHPMTRHGSVREFVGTRWMSFADYQQDYTELHDSVLVARRLGLPVVNSEYAYFLRDSNEDGHVDKPNSATIDDIRHASWDIVTAGGYFVTGFGTTYFAGHRHPGPFNVNAKENIPWEAQVQHIKRLFEQLEWWKLAPADSLISSDAPRTRDRQMKIATGGGSTGAPRPPETTYWCLARPGETYVVYVRGLGEPLTLTLDATGGLFQVREFNPRTGQLADLGTRELDASFDYTARDAQDWVLLLERGE